MNLPLTLAPVRQLQHTVMALRLRTAATLWGLPVLLTLGAAPASAILTATTLAALICAVANLRRPASILITLPFFAMLSPMTGLLDLGVANLVFSDLMFLPLAVQAVLLLIARRRPAQPRVPVELVTLAFLFAAGVVVNLAAGWLVTSKPLLYLVQMAIVAWFSAAYATHHEDWLAVQRAWIVACVYGAAILLHAYGEGRNLDTLKDVDIVATVAPNDLLSLFRATYYYTGFHYLLGLCSVWVALRLVFPATRMNRLMLTAALAVLVPALVATVNKTAIAATFVATTATMLMLFVRFPRKMAAVMVWFGLLGAAGLAVAGWQFAQLAENAQIDLIFERLFSAGSLLTRLEVYLQAMEIWSSSAWTVLLGFGADFLDGSGNPAFADTLKTSATTGYVEGTLDSAWLSYMVELGLPALVLLLALFAGGLAKALRGLNQMARFDDHAYAQASLFGGLIFLAIAMTTQMLGYSKTSWLPLQLLVVAAIGLRTRELG